MVEAVESIMVTMDIDCMALYGTDCTALLSAANADE